MTKHLAVRPLLPVLASMGMMLASPLAWAEDIERARALFAEAEGLREQGRHAESAERLRGALAIKQTPGLWFHLAHSLSETGRLLEAREAYDRSRALLAQGVEAPDVEALLGPAVRRLEERIPTLTVKLPAEVRGASVSVDDERVKAGRGITVDPGRHRIVVDAPGYDPSEVTIDVGVGARRVVEPVMRPAPAETPGVAQDGASGSSARMVVLAVELGVAAAGLSLGVIESVTRASAADRVAAQNGALDEIAPGNASICAAPTDAARAPCDALSTAIDDRDRAETLAIVGYGVGVAGVASFVTTLFLWPAESSRSGADSGAARGSLRAVAGPQGFFGAFRGRF